MSYRVKTVASMTGIPRPTLLAWERRYDILEPRRSDSGYRSYTDEDVALLRRLKALVDAGHPIGEAVQLARVREAEEARPADPLRERLLERLVRYDRAAVDAIAPELGQLSFLRALDEIYLPILQETGDAWEAGRLSVAQEHFVAQWCREQMTAIFHALGAGPAGGPVAVCAMAPGELHELGLLAVSIKLALSGWRVAWLGADLPIAELVAAARAARPRLVCVSAMLPQSRDAVREQARYLRASLDASAHVVVGGPAVADLEAESTAGLLFCPTWSALASALPALGQVA